MTYSFSYLEPVCCSMSSSNCCFLTCIQVSQEAGQGIWYSHLFQNFLQFVVIHTVKDFGIANKADINVFLELSCFFNDPADVGNLISGSSAFSKISLNIWKFTVHILLTPQFKSINSSVLSFLYNPTLTSIHVVAAVAAAKSLQSCPTLCYPMDSSPPGYSVHRSLQARILEWVAISFSYACMHAC